MAKKKRIAKTTRKRVRKDVVKAALDSKEPPEDLQKGVERVDLDRALTGKDTEPLPKETRKRNAEQSTPRAKAKGKDPGYGAVCARCGKHKAKNKYRQLTYQSPVQWDTVCLACRWEEENEDFKAEVRERAAQRQAQKDVKSSQLKRKRNQRSKVRTANALRNHQEAQKKKSEAMKARVAKLGDDEMAKRELARRELCRRRLLYFVHAFHPEYEAGWVHADICARLERFYADVKAGKSPRLMLFMPPRHGKSTIASKLFPAWVFGQDPTTNVIAASYGSTLPVDFSRYVRNCMSEELYKHVFPRAVLDRNKTNVENWGLTKGGEYIAAGVGTGISGRGADILIIDDPIKDAEQADSETVRAGTLNWYKSTAYTRLSPSGGVLIIMTRWHDDDLAGALEAEEKEMVKDANDFMESEIDSLIEKYGSRGEIPANELQACYDERDRQLRDIDRWEIVRYEAIAENDEYRLTDGTIVNEPQEGAQLLRKGGGVKGGGEALHPQRWPRKRLMRIYNNYKKRNTRFWHALYQQTPVPAGGVVFTTEDIHQQELPPDYIWRKWTIIQAWDLAIGTKQRNNYTVGITGAIDPYANLWVIDMVRGKWETEMIISMILDRFMRYKPFRIGVERGHLEMVIAPAIKKEVRERNAKLKQGEERYAPVFLEGKEALVPNQDKVLRARPVQGLMQAGAVKFATGNPWFEVIQAELLRFPSGVLDDTVDALAWLGYMALRTPAPKKDAMEALQRWRERESWRAKLLKDRLAARRASFMEA